MSGPSERRSSRRTRPPKRTFDGSGTAEDVRPRPKRQKPTPRTQSDKDVRSHLTSYASTRIMYSELLASAPQFGKGELEPAYLQAVKDINEIQDMIDDFAHELERKVASFNVSCQHLERSSYASDKWWDYIDIFSPTIPGRYLDDLDEHPPKDVSQWSQHIQSRMTPVMDIIRPHIYNGEGLNYLRTPFWNQKTLFPRVLREISRLGTMIGGEVEAIRLFLHLKLNYLHCNLDHGNTTYIFVRPDDHVDMHRKLDEVLREVLQSISRHPLHIYVRNRRLDPPWINAARHCREIRQHPEKPGHIACEHDRASNSFFLSGCFQKNVAFALDMLQRHAYTEIKVNVYRAVGRRLPKELTDHVFACALQAEQIPIDPRIIIEGKGRVICGEHEEVLSVPVATDE